MLYVNTAPSKPGRVNLNELKEVREHLMPPTAVRFAKPCQLERVAAEITRQRPELREETHFVVQEELGRRQQLAQVPMQAVEGGQRYA